MITLLYKFNAITLVLNHANRRKEILVLVTLYLNKISSKGKKKYYFIKGNLAQPKGSYDVFS